MRKPRLRELCLLLVSVLLLMLVSPTAANAFTSQARSKLPVIVGTQLWGKWSRQNCTAGVVLSKKGLAARLSPKENATRYVVLSKHCIRREHEPVEIRGGDGSDSEVGQVVALANPDDLALVRIEPRARLSYSCGAGKFGYVCTSTYSYTPQAFNTVLLPGLGTDNETTLPMTGQGVPAPGENFCTSGSVTRSMCDWTSTGVPPAWVPNQVYAAAVSGAGSNLLKGDSGGAVVSRTGTFYGIATDSGLYSTDPALRAVMGYTDAARVLSDFSRYRMAPAG